MLCLPFRQRNCKLPERQNTLILGILLGLGQMTAIGKLPERQTHPNPGHRPGCLKGKHIPALGTALGSGFESNDSIEQLPERQRHPNPGHRPGSRKPHNNQALKGRNKKYTMAQSLAQVYLHTVFSTKYRQKLITPDIEPSLYAYIVGVISNQGGITLEINGISDHIHILSTLPRTVTIAKYLEEIKRSSSKWMKAQSLDFKNFAWQGGYATFSVSASKVNVVSKYIRNQKEHHKKLTYKEEVIQFLKEYKVEYNEQYLWD